MNWPPPERRKPRRMGTSGPSRNGSLGERANSKRNTKPIVVYVDSPNRTVQWGRFADVTTAERTKAQLARWGFQARIVDEQVAP